MNELFVIGLLLIIGYSAGLLLEKAGIPKIIGYILTGIVFSPYSFEFVPESILESSSPLIDTCLGFIIFEVGGSLKWSKLKNYKKQLLNILLFESLTTYILIITVFVAAGYVFAGLFTIDPLWVFILALLLAPMGAPTDPTATFAIMHEYSAKGKLSNTIIEVAALDDAMGVFLFSLSTSVAFILAGDGDSSIIMSSIEAFYTIAGALGLGVLIGWITRIISNMLKTSNEGQWIVILAAFIIFTFGLSSMLGLDKILAMMAFGAYTTNFNEQQETIFKIIERYTEELIILFFFILSALHLDITAIPGAVYLIGIFVVARLLGKYFGARAGAYLGGAPKEVQKCIGGGLLPQGGIVIGLALMISQEPAFNIISDTLLATVMGSAVINEIIGPFSAKAALTKAGEIRGD